MCNVRESRYHTDVPAGYTFAVIPKKNGQILLARKGRGFGKGKWVGFGGKVSSGETVEQANTREMMEETGVRVDEARKIGLILFTFDCAPEYYLEVHLFESNASFDTITLNDEYVGDPVWFPVESIPFSEMWPDFKLWVTHLLDGHRFRARISYTDYSTIRKSLIRIVDDLDTLASESNWQ